MGIENLEFNHTELSTDQQARREMGKDINTKDSQEWEKVGNIEDLQSPDSTNDTKKVSGEELKKKIEQIRSDEAITRSMEHPTPEEILAQLGAGTSPDNIKPLAWAVNESTVAPTEASNSQKA